MNRLLKFGAIIVLLIFSGCITQKKCLEKFPPKETRDSVYIETVKEVPVMTPGDTIKVDVPINCPDQNILQYENDRLRQTIFILHGRLVSKTDLKPYTFNIKVVDSKQVVKSTIIPPPEKYIPKIYKDALWICIIIFAGAFTWFGFKVFKFFK